MRRPAPAGLLSGFSRPPDSSSSTLLQLSDLHGLPRLIPHFGKSSLLPKPHSSMSTIDFRLCLAASSPLLLSVGYLPSVWASYLPRHHSSITLSQRLTRLLGLLDSCWCKFSEILTKLYCLPPALSRPFPRFFGKHACYPSPWRAPGHFPLNSCTSAHATADSLFRLVTKTLVTSANLNLS